MKTMYFNMYEFRNALSTLETEYGNDEVFVKDKKNILILKQNIINAKLKLLSYQEKYEELHKYYLENFKEIKEMDLNRVIFYCNKKLGKINSDRRQGHSYLFRQIVDYKESDFLEHIKRHILDSRYSEEKNHECIFSENLPITEIIEEVKKYLPSDKALYTGDIADEYTFKYEECGRVKNKTVDYIKVVCFHNTKDIITIYPAIEGEKLPHFDLDYMIKDKRPVTKIKRLSQIEKFNQRYKR